MSAAVVALHRFTITCAAGHNGTSVPESKPNPAAYLAEDFAALGCGMCGCREPVGVLYRDGHNRNGRRVTREPMR